MRSWRTDIGHHCRRHGSLVVALVLALVVAHEPRRDRPVPVTPTAVASPASASVAAGVAASSAPAAGIVVRVTAGGTASEGAEVAIRDGSGPVLSSVRTDREGIARFTQLPAGPYELWAIRDAQASPLARIELTDAATLDLALDLALEPASVVHGDIGATGVPEGATVQLVPLDIDHAVRVASVDVDGHFVVAGVPASRWRIEASVPGYAQTAETIVTAKEADVTASLALVPTGTLRGTVVDQAGHPVANATLTLRDTAGTSLWPLSLATAGTRWIHPIAGIRELPANPSAHFGAVRPGFRPAECGRGHCGVDLGSERGPVVHAVASGTIAALFPDGRTEAGRVVSIQHGGGLRSWYMHLDEIRPGLEVGQAIRAGEPVGIVGSTGILHSVAHLHFAVTQEYRGRTWYIDPEPMLRHAVVLAAPRVYEPVDPARVAKDPVSTSPAAAAPHVVTDAHGAFVIENVPPGNYVAVAFEQGLAPGTSAAFDIRSGETTGDIAITLRDGATVRGHITGPRGAIAGAQVTASTSTGETIAKVASTSTDRTGAFTLRALAGKVTIVVTAPGYSAGERALDVDSGVHDREDFSLQTEDGELRGQLLAPDGGAAARVTVRVVEGVSRKWTTTDAQGRFTIAPVVSGRYVVELVSAEYPRTRLALDSARFAELRLERGGAIRALVRASRDPVAGARVVARGPGGQTVERVTDAAGAIELRALRAGSWTLSVRAPGLTTATRTVTVRAGAVADDVQLELARAATLAGIVRDRFGRRVAGATITFAGMSTTSDADGNFRFVDVPAGAGTLEAQHDGERGALDLELAAGDERRTLVVEMR